MPKGLLRARRASLVTAVLVAGAIGLTACGSSSPSTSGAAGLVSTALKNAYAATWVHEVASAKEPGHLFSAVNDIGATSGRQGISIDGAISTVMVLDNMAYLRGNEKAILDYFQIPAKHPKALAGKWISLVPTDTGYTAVSSAVTISSDFKQVKLSAPLTEGVVTTLHGVRVIPIHGHVNGQAGKALAATLYVSATGSTLPMAFLVSSGKFSSLTTWSKWNVTVTLVAPSPVIPFATIKK